MLHGMVVNVRWLFMGSFCFFTGITPSGDLPFSSHLTYICRFFIAASICYLFSFRKYMEYFFILFSHFLVYYDKPCVVIFMCQWLEVDGWVRGIDAVTHKSQWELT